MISIRSTYRFVALMMAFLMFFTSTGFAMDMHYCSGELKSVNFLGKAKTCHDIADNGVLMQGCPHHKMAVKEDEGCSEDKNCCSNKVVHLQADQDQEIKVNEFIFSTELKRLVIAYATFFLSNNFGSKCEVANFTLYKPPLILRDIPVLNETFLL